MACTEKENYNNKEWLYKEYITKEKHIHEIANENNVSYSVIQRRLVKFDIPRRSQKDRKREKNPNWKGGISKRNGYITLLKHNHPKADRDGYVYEHIFVMEKHIGRALTSEEEIHHIDENKTNNRINNLYLCKDYGEHMQIHQSLGKIALDIYKLGEFYSIDFDHNKGQYYIKRLEY